MTTNDGLWRDEGTLVMHKSAALPEVCVVTGAPATRRIVRKLAWYPPWIAWTLLLVAVGAGVITFIILALVFTKRATITLPLSDAAFARRRTRVVLAWLGGLASVGAIVLGFARAAQTGTHLALWLGAASAGFVGIVVTAALGQRAANVVRVKSITDTHVALDGVHASVLEPLPPASLRQTRARMWEWSLPGGERVLARLDHDGTESVWLGGRLVSRGVKPDGHDLALAGGAYRGGGSARVLFQPGMAAASLELDGATVAPSPFAAAPPLPMRRASRTTAAVVAIACVVVLVGALVGIQSAMRARTRGHGISRELVFALASKDGDIVAHYPRELTAEALGDSGVQLAGNGGASVTLDESNPPLTTDLDELARAALDAKRGPGITVLETSRTTTTCHGQRALVVDARVQDETGSRKLHACVFVTAGRSFALVYVAPEERASDEAILRSVVEGAEIRSLLEAAAAATASGPAALMPVGDTTAACRASETVCSSDGTKLVQCRSGRPVLVLRPCLGAGGCTVVAGDARCDQTIARHGEPCDPAGRIACSEDGKSELTCTSDRADFVPPLPPPTPAQVRHPSPPPIIRNGRVIYPPPTPEPPRPPPKPLVIVPDNASLVWAHPRACKTACKVQDGRVLCD